jgi:site-specific DNA-methyltransferase (adenine-specific)
MKKTKLMLGDNMESLKKLPDNSVDSVVTDPPYGLSFMNKKWDYDVPSVEYWTEVYRVLKPGGHILSFGGTRTYHRMVVNIEDAGFEIRDQIQWIYGSGFPKSHNIGKAVDKLEGNEREVVGERLVPDQRGGGINSQRTAEKGFIPTRTMTDTKGQSEFEGWGTALKPANEPICVARKPLSEKSVAENVLKWGTGGINIDGCRVSGIDEANAKRLGKSYKSENSNLGNSYNLSNEKYKDNITVKVGGSLEGRFPANIILECICDEVIKGEKGEKTTKETNINNKEANWFRSAGGDKEERWSFNDKGDTHTDPNCPCRLLDEHSGFLKSGEVKPHHKKNKTANGYQGSCYGKFQNEDTTLKGYGDGGGASRFFYQAKVSKAERNMGLDGFDEKQVYGTGGSGFDGISGSNKPTKNFHPTVKPINLMAYLCRLITPEGGIVLDPFMGSGSTGVAAQLEGFRFVGMEMDADYFKIAEARINSYEEYKKFIKK